MKMRYFSLFWLLIFGFSLQALSAQEVNIFIPSENINSGQPYMVSKNVMFLHQPYWRHGYITHQNPSGVIFPTVKALGEPKFVHQSDPNISLPASVLEWRLESIGGLSPIFHAGDIWPGYKIFSSSEETWYEPAQWNIISPDFPYTQGQVIFSFRISEQALLQNNFQAGTYSMEVLQNYDAQTEPSGSGNASNISPGVIKINLIVDENLSWTEGSNSFQAVTQDLDDYRGSHAWKFNLGNFRIANSTAYNLKARSINPSVHFISSQGEQHQIELSKVYLRSHRSEINPVQLNINFQSMFDAQNGTQNLGNTDFDLELEISKNYFRNYFFRAGSYNFQFELEAENYDFSSYSDKIIDFTLKVLPLSEIKLTSQESIDLIFVSAADYQFGKSKTIPGQLTLSNNESFELYLKSGTAYFLKSGMQTSLSSDILQIGVEGETSLIHLSTQPQKVLNQQNPVLDKVLNMTYQIPDSAAQTLLEKEKGVYTIEIFYSFTVL